ALAMLSKYFAVILGATCLIAAFTQPNWRSYFGSFRPYLSAAAALLVFSPHIWWLVQTGFLPFHYFDGETGRSYTPVLAHALGTLGAIVALHIFVIAVVASSASISAARWWRSAMTLWRAPNERMLIVLAMAPIVLTIAVALICRNKVSANMLIGTVSLLPLLLIKTAAPDETKLMRRAIIGAVTVTLVSLALSPAIAVAKMRFSREPDVMQPRAEVAQIVTQIWRRTTSAPLSYVAGSEFYANATSFYSPEHPHVFIDFDYHEAPWVTPQRLQNGGLLVVCDEADAPCLSNANRTSSSHTSRTRFTFAHTYAGISKPPVHFSVFVTAPPVPPRELRH
ncbi:MAG: glycosyltransferase family 39 protein, partial [Proteobacteria bacterium]|nr:glycosyltransferase family 39 protein [Pseudomonadota bacterium]